VDVRRPPPDDPELSEQQDNRAMAAGVNIDLDRWREEFDELMLRIGSRFARVEP
jgi:hypothetical protein